MHRTEPRPAQRRGTPSNLAVHCSSGGISEAAGSPSNLYRSLMSALRLLAVAAAAAVALASCSSTPPPLSQNQKELIGYGLQKVNFPAPTSLEVNNSGFVVATFGGVDPSRVADGGRVFAKTALIRIREQLLPAGTYKQFLVTINGMSPRTGKISRYGSARLIEGGQLDWEQGR